MRLEIQTESAWSPEVQKAIRDRLKELELLSKEEVEPEIAADADEKLAAFNAIAGVNVKYELKTRLVPKNNWGNHIKPHEITAGGTALYIEYYLEIEVPAGSSGDFYRTSAGSHLINKNGKLDCWMDYETWLAAHGITQQRLE